MPNHFLAAGVYGCVYYPGYTCEGKTMKKNKKWVSKLSYQNEKTDTEVEVGKRLKSIPGSDEHFVLVQRHCSIPYKSLSEMKKGCELIKKGKSYILLYSAYVNSMELYKYLQANTLFVRVFRCYYQVCEKIALLIEHNIVHHDLHFANILYSKENANLYVIDFGLALLADKFHSKMYLSSVFSRYYPEWSWYALEIHILTYLIQYGHLSEKAVNQTIEMYLKNHHVLRLGPELTTRFKREAEDFFLPLVDSDTQECIDYLLSFWSTWDYYEISLRFLHVYLENKSVYPAYYDNLISMTCANPEKRPKFVSIHKTIQSFDVSHTLTQEYKLDKLIATSAFKKN